MNTLDAIRTRYSCRAFTDQPIPRNDLTQIAEAAVAAPSGMNRQPWRILVVTDPKVLADLENAAITSIQGTEAYDRIMSRGGKVFYNAPAMIVVTAKTEADGSISNGTALDCGIVAQNVALAATALGIDNVICGMARGVFGNADLNTELGFAPGYTFGISILLGYAVSPGGEPHVPDLTKITYL